MFQKVLHTQFPPSQKPMMVYDGKCGFCKYWIIKWQKITEDKVEYRPFQEVAMQYKDIDLSYFKSAVRYIDMDGKISSGPDAAYITYYLFSKPKFLHRWYNKKRWFQWLSDWGYEFIATNRSFMFDLSKALFGKNPTKYRPYWLLYFCLLSLLLLSLVYFY